MVKRNKAKYKFKLNDSDANREKYNKARNRCNTACRDAQRRHIFQSVENGDTAKTWKFLQTLGVGKSSRNTSINIDIELLNKHFTSSGTFNSADKNTTLNTLSSLPTPNFPPFTFDAFTECDVKRNITSITSNAVGTDCISRNMITPILDIVTPILTHIFNYSITCNKFPIAWKDAQVLPLPKKGNPITVSDFRPISILPFISKVLEKLVFQQLNFFLNKHSLLSPFQSGFRAGHSTTTALIKVTDDIRVAMDSKQLTVLALLDFSNAFNSVDYDILLSLLCSFNISPSVKDWFQSYLKGRRQRIRTDEALSSWCDVRSGVPQGGVLSPLLFSIFINSITHVISSLYHMYADDIQIYRRSTPENLSNAIAAINNDLDAIAIWSKHFGININPGKSQIIVIGSKGMLARVDFLNLPPIVYNGVILSYCSTVKDLGLYLDNTLSWTEQIKQISRKFLAAFRSLRRLQALLPIPTKIMLANSLLLPILDYADASYPNLSEEQLNKLERLQNLAIRFIFGLRKYDHVSEFRTKLKWLPIRRRRDMHILSLLYCVLFNPNAPFYLKEKFTYLGSPTTQRSVRRLMLKTPAHSTKMYAQSFTVQAIKLWNELPSTIRLSKSINIFKKSVKDYFTAS